jgi:hypothetical protein
MPGAARFDDADHVHDFGSVRSKIIVIEGLIQLR